MCTDTCTGLNISFYFPVMFYFGFHRGDRGTEAKFVSYLLWNYIFVRIFLCNGRTNECIICRWLIEEFLSHFQKKTILAGSEPAIFWSVVRRVIHCATGPSLTLPTIRSVMCSPTVLPTTTPPHFNYYFSALMRFKYSDLIILVPTKLALQHWSRVKAYGF
jgi:hypothetical protein